MSRRYVPTGLQTPHRLSCDQCGRTITATLPPTPDLGWGYPEHRCVDGIRPFPIIEPAATTSTLPPYPGPCHTRSA